jgi:hypothetical protein
MRVSQRGAIASCDRFLGALEIFQLEFVGKCWIYSARFHFLTWAVTTKELRCFLLRLHWFLVVKTTFSGPRKCATQHDERVAHDYASPDPEGIAKTIRRQNVLVKKPRH